LTRITTFRQFTSTLISDLRRLNKRAVRELKEAARANKRKRRKRANNADRAPSGFAKPTQISAELCTFLGLAPGTEVARTEVTKQMSKYIKNNNLQDQENRRRILCDEALRNLLSVNEDDEVTYFNLQKYLKPHFVASSSK
tara:strand:+ start:1211 stop:1633 length:423 start_codon:yes stop_codon:yes gene_type:complete